MKKKLKIIIPVIIAIVVVVIITIVVSNNQNDISKKEVFNNAQQAYKDLNIVVDDCSEIMSSVYNAWYYGIYGKKNSVYEFSSEAQLDSSEVRKVLEKLTGSSANYNQDQYIQQSDFSELVNVTILVYTNNGKIPSIDTKLNSVKNTLKEMADKYSDYEHYPKLKEYYSKASSYYTFIKLPTGSFNQLATTINDYKNNLRTYKEDLEFVFDN